MILTIDASVVVKWVLPSSASEAGADQALALLAGVERGEVSVVQPVHWLAEVAAVLVRLRPAIAAECVGLLDLMELPVAAEGVVLQRACRLSAELGHHLFDTLYHAVALERGGLLVTAHARRARRARRAGGVIELGEWPPGGA